MYYEQSGSCISLIKDVHPLSWLCSFCTLEAFFPGVRYQYWGSFLSTLIKLSLIHSQFFCLSSYFPESRCAPHSWLFLCFPPLSLHWYMGLSKRKIPMNPYKMQLALMPPPPVQSLSNCFIPTLHIQTLTRFLPSLSKHTCANCYIWDTN